MDDLCPDSARSAKQLNGLNEVRFVAKTRVGDVSNDIKVEYSVKDLASERNDNKSFTGAVTIPAGGGASKGSAIPKVGKTLPTITKTP